MAQLFIKIAILMFGGQWQSSLASELGINERTLRRFVAGTSPIPVGIWNELRRRLFNKGVEVQRMHERLTGLLPHTGKIALSPIANTKPDVELDGLYFWLDRPDGKRIRCRASRGIFGDLGAERPNDALPIFEKCSDSFYRAASTKFELGEYDDRIGIFLEPDDVIVMPNDGA
ncbi:hypothetical protein UP09_20615 [Bradyrhizobium sp. LTSP885]|uniref:hypothetical protein n=1 Tax=Bradyrhizobium sp. LTSP885 TaxID=1619232 RepID=UPI0005CA8257|nr:hypothetical protein [Bradyrhizobium sp. LTSP885]KJC41495.1 hypothetical protein UP09_20615 [Bradyrhizobium sp. LTSP885]